MTPGFDAIWGRRSIAAGGPVRETASVAVRLQEARQASQARVDLIALVDDVVAPQRLAALGAEALAVGAAERVHRLSQRELLAEDGGQVELVMLVDKPRRLVALRSRQCGAAVRVDAGQVLLRNGDGGRL